MYTILQQVSDSGRRTIRQIDFIRSRQGAGFHVLTLMSGAAAAQLLTIVAAPILTRIYTPTDFGIFAIYATVLLISAPLVSGRYELAIVPAKDEDEAFGLLVLSCLIAAAMGVSVGVLLRLRTLTSITWISSLTPYFWIIPPSIALNGSFQALRQFCIRQRRYRALSVSQLVQSGSSAGGQAAAGVLLSAGATGLLIGQFGGLAASVFSLRRGLVTGFRSWYSRHRDHPARTLWRLAISHRRHPAYLPWGGLVDVLATRLPLLVLPTFYGATFLGLYAIADRLVKTPLLLVGQASAQVMFQKMTEKNVKARMPQVLLTWGILATLVCLVPFVLLAYFAPLIFTFALGKAWASAGPISVALIPVYWGALVVSPVSTLLLVANRQDLILAIEVLSLVCGYAALWAGHLLLANGTQTVLLYSLSQLFTYVIYFAMLFVISKSMAETSQAEVSTCAE